MRLSAHIRLFLIAIGVWTGFWVAGLPDYYQQYSFSTMVMFSLVLVPIVVFAGLKVIGRRRVERRRTFAVWLAFYFTVPFALLDYLYCGLYLGQGLEFLARFWYLTAYYILPWFVFVPIGYRLSQSPSTIGGRSPSKSTTERDARKSGARPSL